MQEADADLGVPLYLILDYETDSSAAKRDAVSRNAF